MNTFNLAYTFTVTACFICLYYYFHYKVRLSESGTLKKLKKKNIQDAVETGSPVEDSISALKEKGKADIEYRFNFINRIVPVFLFIFWITLICIPFLGKLPSVYISIIVAVISVLIGVSTRPFLENLFSGVIISFFRSIRIGDTVIIDGHYGLIEEIGLTYSVLKRWDWHRIVLPNSKLLQTEIQNMSMYDQYIWAYAEFYVEPSADIALVETIALEAAESSEFNNHSEKPSFWVMSLERDAVKCWIAAWADTPGQAWELKNDLRTKILKRLQQEKIQFHEYNLAKAV